MESPGLMKGEADAVWEACPVRELQANRFQRAGREVIGYPRASVVSTLLVDQSAQRLGQRRYVDGEPMAFQWPEGKRKTGQH